MSASDLVVYLDDVQKLLTDAKRALGKSRCPTRDRLDVEAFRDRKAGLTNLLTALALVNWNALVAAHEFDEFEGTVRAAANKDRARRTAQQRGEGRMRRRGLDPAMNAVPAEAECPDDLDSGSLETLVANHFDDRRPPATPPESVDAGMDNHPQDENPNDADPGEHAIMQAEADLWEQAEREAERYDADPEYREYVNTSPWERGSPLFWIHPEQPGELYTPDQGDFTHAVATAVTGDASGTCAKSAGVPAVPPADPPPGV